MSDTAFSPYRWVILGVGSVLIMSTQGWILLSLPVFLPYIARDLSLTPASSQFIFGIVSLIRVGTYVLGGVLGDLYSSKWTVGGGGLLVGGSALLRGAVPGYGWSLVASVILGLGLGLVIPNLLKALAQWFPSEELGLANGVRLMGTTGGAALAQGVVAIALIRTLGDWMGAQVALGGFALLISLGWMVLFTPSSAAREQAERAQGVSTATSILQSLRGFRRLFSLPSMAVLAGVVFLRILAGLGFVGMLPTWLHHVEFVRKEWVGFYSSLMFWFAVPGTLVLPALSDRIGRRKIVLYVSLGVTVMGLGFIAAALNIGALLPLVLGVVLVGGAGGGFMPIALSIPAELPDVGPTLMGTATGFLLSLGQLGGAIGPPLGGYAFELGGIPLSMMVILLPYFGMVFGVFMLEETGSAARGEETVENSPEREGTEVSAGPEMAP